MSVFTSKNVTGVAMCVDEIGANPRCKEKTIKIVQYYCQFLAGYHSAPERRGLPGNATALAQANRVMNTFSMARKAVRWMKWIVHASAAQKEYQMIQEEARLSGGAAVHPWRYANVLAELSLTAYFIGDNWQLMSRAGLVPHNQFLCDMEYTGDFVADCSCVYSFRLQLQELAGKIKTLKVNISTENNEDLLKNKKKQLVTLETKQYDMQLDLTISALQIIQSANQPPVRLWKRLFGQNCPETIVGLSGVLSSSLVMYQVLVPTLKSAFGIGIGIGSSECDSSSCSSSSSVAALDCDGTEAADKGKSDK
jgi:hypothetical protein